MNVLRLAVLLALAGCQRYAGQVTPENEAYRMLTSIERGARNAFEMETAVAPEGPFVHRFCPSSTMPHAPGAPWTDAAWTCLKLSSNEKHKFHYEYLSNGKDGAAAECTATATRRLDDGRMQVITLVLRGKATGETERVSLTTVER